MENNYYIVDTNVLISSFLKKNSSPKRILQFIHKNGSICFSTGTMLELKEKLYQEKFDRYISKEKRDNFFNILNKSALFFNPKNTFILYRDPKDSKFLVLALESNADFLITGDDDLLSLKEIGDTTIISPASFLRRQESMSR